MSRGRALWGLMVLIGCGPSGGAPDASVRPRPAPTGTGLDAPTVHAFDSTGGQLTSGDGRLSVVIPSGVLAGATEVQIQQVSNTAPGGVGSAYRLEPEGLLFAAPVTITFTADPSGPALEELSVAYQEGQGYWLHAPKADVVRDATRRTVTVTTRHFSGWTLVAGPTPRDLHGTFTFDSSLDIPFTGASGAATFTFAGEDPGVAWYLLAGTLTLPRPLPMGGDTCVPTAPEVETVNLRTNIAELRSSPAAFFWGLSGHWNLTCTGAAGSRAELLLAAFDTQGIGALGCARGYDAGLPLVIGPDKLQGTYVIDCGVKGTATTSWDFVSNACGGACTPALPCHTASLDCASGTGVCLDDGVVPDGSPGACPSPQTCLGGVCAP